MNDDAMVHIIETLGLDYGPAINATKSFEARIASLNKQIFDLKANAVKGVGDINKAFSSQLGQFSGGGFSDGNVILDQYGGVLKRVKTFQEELANIGKNPIKPPKVPVPDDKDFNIWADQWQRRTQWFLSGTLFYGSIKAVKEAVQTMSEVEMGVTEIARVMEDGTFAFKDYRDELLQLGIDYGQTFDTVQDIALRWAQAGYNVKDSLENTKTSLLALNTAELNASNATESLIGIMAQWQLTSKDLPLVLDKINKTADDFTVTSQDLVDGLLRSSGAAKIMGMSLDDTIAVLTVMREASGRTGREVGNALNSILSYIQRAKSIDVIESMGISMFADKARTQFRNVMEIFAELAAKWNDPKIAQGAKDALMAGAQEAGLFSEELANAIGVQAEYAEMTKKVAAEQEKFTDIEKRDAAQAAAGVYRRNYFIGLLERFSKTQEVLNGMTDAAGYSMRENERTMDTLEKKYISLKAAAQELAVAIGDAGVADALKTMVDAGTDAINVLNDMPKPMRDMVLSATSVFVAVKTLEMGMKTFGIQLPGISQMIASLTSGTWSLTAALKAGGAGIATFAKANAPLLALSAAVGIIVAITNHVKKQREEMEKSISVFQQQKEISNSINTLLPAYEELASKSALTADEQQKLLDIKRQITDLLPNTKQALDNENMSLETQLQIVKDLNEEELERAKSKARETLEKHERKYDYYKQDAEEAKKSLEKWTAVYEGYYQRRDTLTKEEQKNMRDARLLIDAQSERLEVNKSNIEAVDAARGLYNETLKNENSLLDENIIKTGQASVSQQGYKKTLEDTTKLFSDTTSKLQTYYSILDEANSKQGISGKTLQDIITKHQELLPYLGDEAVLREKLVELIAQEEKVQHTAYSNMLMYSEEFFNAKIKGNHDLVKKLEEYYNVDLENAKSLAQAKEKIENELIRNLSGKWAAYYNALTVGQNQALGDDLAKAAMHGSKEANDVLQAVQAYKEMEDRFNKIVLDYGGIDFKGINTSGIKDSKSKHENKALNEALKLLEHRKRISEETQDTIKAEIAELNRINSLYVKTDDERMNMAERIYAAEKRLREKTLQDSIKWINEKKALGELSAEEEIAAWERVKKNQINNIDAVKEATANLYKLRKQLQEDEVKEQKDSLKDLQDSIKDAYNERIKAIEKEADAKKKAQEEIIKGIEEELKLLDRQDSEYDYDKKMADLKEQEAYWSVRTGENARQQLADVRKKIAEAEHDREVELQKQGLQDKKDAAKDEIDLIQETAKEQKEKWQAAYKDMEKAFKDHNIDIVANAATYSKEAYQQWYDNYIVPMQQALRNGDIDSFEDISDRLGGSIDTLPSHDYNMTDKDYNIMMRNKARWWELYNAGNKHNDNIEMQRVNAENDTLRAKYNIPAGQYPKFHSGGETLSEGWAKVKPGEFFFPPDLSKDLKTLIAVSSGITGKVTNSSSKSYDNRKIVNLNGPLLNVENMPLEDEIDGEILSRQLQHAVRSIK